MCEYGTVHTHDVDICHLSLVNSPLIVCNFMQVKKIFTHFIDEYITELRASLKRKHYTHLF